MPAAKASVVVLDVSTTGCRIRAGSEFAQVGATILLKVSPRDELAGQVVWRDRGECGVHFHKAIGDDVVDRIASVIS